MQRAHGATGLAYSVKHRILAEQVALLWRSSVLLFLANLAVAFLVVLVLWRRFPWSSIAWFLALSVVLAVRYVLYLRHRRLIPEARDPHTWRRWFVAFTAVVGTVWGALSLVFFPTADLSEKLCIAFALAGMTTGAVATNSYIKAAWYGFSLPALSPLILVLFWQRDWASLQMGVMTVLFLLGTSIAARRFNRAVVRALEAKFEVGGLVEQLSSAKQTLEANNEELDRLLSENRLMVETATTGMVFIRDAKVAHCNRRFEELFGYAPGEMIGKATSELYISNQTKRQEVAAQQTMLQGEVYEEDALLARRDGSAFWCHRAGRLFDSSDPAQGVIWDYANIDEANAWNSWPSTVPGMMR